ncbi:hypothetical protein K466DRAFT_607514 [Polyporus arcularius HHB13444]|uniref:Uncharacterized protein n=1 Tax=Polyporus arcularius HHB13444 TaxID=1314778 RepID=A0A5C3NL47_9APHY|nr:hypothetical protein K466DRAFT_607514 [Polyporus arcularius HHB13444]
MEAVLGASQTAVLEQSFATLLCFRRQHTAFRYVLNSAQYYSAVSPRPGELGMIWWYARAEN